MAADEYDEMYEGEKGDRAYTSTEHASFQERIRSFFRKFDEGSSAEWDTDLGRSDTVSKAMSHRSIKVAGVAAVLAVLSFLGDIAFSRLMANSVSDLVGFVFEWATSLGGIIGDAPAGLSDMTGVGFALMLLLPCLACAACVMSGLTVWYGYSDFKMLRDYAIQGHPAIEQGKKRAKIAIAMGVAGIILVII